MLGLDAKNGHGGESGICVKNGHSPKETVRRNYPVSRCLAGEGGGGGGNRVWSVWDSL